MCGDVPKVSGQEEDPIRQTHTSSLSSCLTKTKFKECRKIFLLIEHKIVTKKKPPDQDPPLAKSRCPGWELSTGHPSQGVDISQEMVFWCYLHSEDLSTKRGKAGNLEDQIQLWSIRQSTWGKFDKPKADQLFSASPHLRPTQSRQAHHKSLTWGPEATDKGSSSDPIQDLFSELRRHKITSATSSSAMLPKNLCVRNLWFRFRGVHTSNNCCPPAGPQVEHQTKSSATFQRGFHCPLPRLPEKSNPSPNIWFRCGLPSKPWPICHYHW